MLYWIHSKEREPAPHATDAATETRRVPRDSSQRRRYFERSRAVLALQLGATALVALATVYAATRFIEGSQHPRPALTLDDALRVYSRRPGEQGQFSVEDGTRLLAIDGQKLQDLAAYRGTIASSKKSAKLLEFWIAGDDIEPETKHVLWMEVDSHAAVHLSDDMRLEKVPVEAASSLERFAGARLVRVNDIPVKGPDDVSRALNARWASRPLYEFEAADGSGEVAVALSLVDWDARFAVLLSGVATGLIAIFVIWLRGNLLSSWGFFALGVNICLFSVFRGIPFPYRESLDATLYLLTQAAFPTTITFFLVTFTPLRNLAVHPPGFRFVLPVILVGMSASGVAAYQSQVSPNTPPGLSPLLPAIALMGVPCLVLIVSLLPAKHRIGGIWFYTGAALLLSVSLVTVSTTLYWSETRMGLLGMPVFYAWLVWMSVFFVVTLLSDLVLRVFGLPLSALDRARSRILRWATLCAFLPILVYVPVRGLFEGLVETRFLVEAALVLFPLILAYGIVRQNILQVGELLLETLTGALLLTVGFIIYPLVYAVAVSALREVIPEESGIPSALSVVVLAAVAIGLFVVIGRLRGRRGVAGSASIERFLDALHENAIRAQSVNDVYEFTDAELRRLLGAEDVSLILSGDALGLSSTYARGADGESDADSYDLAFVFDLVTLRGKALFERDLEDEFGMAGVSRPAAETMQRLSSVVALPVTEQETPVGVLMLGKKSTQRNYTAREMTLMNAVAKRVGVSLAGAAQRQTQVVPKRIIDIYPRFPLRIKDFEISGIIGQGGMSYVYLGKRDGIQSAIKIANHRVQADPMLQTRFEREGEILRELDHPNIVRLIETGRIDGEPYLALEYLEHGTLAHRIRGSRRLTESIVGSYTIQIVDALSYAQTKNILHRDVKPSNVYLSGSAMVKIADFGAARLEEDDLFTLTGEIIGTVAYMSPERLDGKPADMRTDQYALGVMMYELLTGARPFQGGNVETQVIGKLAWPGSGTRELEAVCSATFAHIVSRMLMPNPDDRYDTYESIRDDLAAVIA